jgi:hypothetical protein
MTWRSVQGDHVLVGTRGAGTHVSQAFPTSYAAGVALFVHVTAATGTSPTLAVSLEQSNDGTTWAAVPNSAAATVTAVGNSAANASPTQQMCRVVAAIGGTTPSFTFSVYAIASAD